MALRFRRPSAAARLCLYGLALIAVLLLAVLPFIATTLPRIDGELRVAGVERPITIYRDANGFVRIEAASDRDAFFATGFVHAQDRLWQLEVQRRIASGTLSEVLGAQALAHDIWMRNFRFRERAVEDLQALSPQARSSLSAYAEGVNAWVQVLDRLPVEFMLFDVKPESWTEADTLAWVKVFAMNLSGNMSTEIRNHLAAEFLDQPLRELFYGETDDGGYQTIADDEYALSRTLGAQLRQLRSTTDALQLASEGTGSNAWVVSGSHTQSGFPLLANDPHLKLQIPSLWYALAQNGERLRSVGMSLVGTPLVVFGHNGAIAWAGTNMMADVQDLQFHRVNPQNSAQYLYGERWLDFTTRTEYFRIKAQFPAFLNRTPAPVKVTYRETVVGPILSAYDDAFDYPVSLRWSALDSQDRTYEAFFDANYAGNWQGFRRSFAKLGAPPLNILYADTANNIGYTATGRIPVRLDHDGSRPTPGWLPENGWHAFVPYEALPRVFNPPKGFIVNANNKVIGDAYPYFLSKDWAPAFRAQRIAALLERQMAKGERVSVSSAQTMQQDVADLSLLQLKDYLVASYVPREPTHATVLEELRSWDGQMRSDSTAAAIFVTWVDELRESLFFDQSAGHRPVGSQEELQKFLAANASYRQVLAALRSNTSDWCASASGDGHGCQKFLHNTLSATLRLLAKLLGRDIDDWTFAELHEAQYLNLLRIEEGLLGRWFSRRVPSRGAQNAINVSDLRFARAEGYRKTFGAGFRHVIDLGAGKAGYYYMNSTGQSGSVFSPHYDDMIESFESGGTLFDANAPEPGRMSKLTLLKPGEKRAAPAE